MELELKRIQVHLSKADETHQKYKSVKIDYKQLLQSFERSEEIRREQKELINEQSLQLKSLKSKTAKQDLQIAEIGRENEQLKLRAAELARENEHFKLLNSNNLSSILDMSK